MSNQSKDDQMREVYKKTLLNSLLDPNDEELSSFVESKPRKKNNRSEH